MRYTRDKRMNKTEDECKVEEIQKKRPRSLTRKMNKKKHKKKGGDTMRNIRFGEFYCSVLWGVWFAFHAPSSD